MSDIRRSVLPFLTGDTARTATAERALRPVLWWLFAVIWLPFLVYPIRDLLRLHPTAPRLVLTLAGIGLFLVLYLWLMLHKSFADGASARRDVARHLALIALLSTLVLGLTIAYGVDWLWFFIFPGMAAGVNLPTRGALLVVGSLALLELLVGWTTAGWLMAWRLSLPVMGVGLGLIGAARLVATNRELRAAREEIARLAVAEERLRFARDLHDLLGYSLSTITLKNELAQRFVRRDPDRAERELGDAIALARGTLREMREAVGGYRQPTLAIELAGARELLTAAGIDCRCDETAEALPAAVESVLAWAVREGATNVVRHSRALHCSVRVAIHDGVARVDVRDDGRGTGASDAQTGMRGGSGLAGLAERAGRCGGQVVTGTIAGGGFRLTVAIPLTSRVTESP